MLVKTMKINRPKLQIMKMRQNKRGAEERRIRNSIFKKRNKEFLKQTINAWYS